MDQCIFILLQQISFAPLDIDINSFCFHICSYIGIELYACWMQREEPTNNIDTYWQVASMHLKVCWRKIVDKRLCIFYIILMALATWSQSKRQRRIGWVERCPDSELRKLENIILIFARQGREESLNLLGCTNVVRHLSWCWCCEGLRKRNNEYPVAETST